MPALQRVAAPAPKVRRVRARRGAGATEAAAAQLPVPSPPEAITERMDRAPLMALSLHGGCEREPGILVPETEPPANASAPPLALSRDVPGRRLATLPPALADSLLLSRSGPYLPQLAQPPTRKAKRPAWREAMLALLPADANPPANDVLTRVVWSALLRRARAEAAHLSAMSQPQLAQTWASSIEAAISDRQAAVLNRSRAYIDGRALRDDESIDNWRQGERLLSMLGVVSYSASSAARG